MTNKNKKETNELRKTFERGTKSKTLLLLVTILIVTVIALVISLCLSSSDVNADDEKIEHKMMYSALTNPVFVTPESIQLVSSTSITKSSPILDVPIDDETKNEEETEIQIEEVEEEKHVSAKDITFKSVGYVTADKLNIREKPSTESEKIGFFSYNQKIHYNKYDEEWYIAQIDDCAVGYVHSDYVSKHKIDWTPKSVWADSRKSFMDYRTITSPSSRQYKIQYELGAYTSKNGVRAINGRYLIALGSYYSHNIGQYIDVVLEDGTIIKCVLGDAKADQHTVDNHAVGLDGSVVEFLVQKDALDWDVQVMGDVSYVPGWKSKPVEIRLYNKNVFDE